MFGMLMTMTVSGKKTANERCYTSLPEAVQLHFAEVVSAFASVVFTKQSKFSGEHGFALAHLSVDAQYDLVTRPRTPVD